MSGSYSWSNYGREAWRKAAERWDVRDGLRAEIQEVETWLPLFEQSLVDGLRCSEPRVPLKPRALARRRVEIAQMRAFQAWAQEVLARPEQETLRPYPGGWKAREVEQREELERANATRGRHGLRVLAGGRA